MTKNEKKKGVVPFSTISSATYGDVNSLTKILNHYEGYITKLSQYTILDEYGQIRIQTDFEVKHLLENKLIAAILNFKLLRFKSVK